MKILVLLAGAADPKWPVGAGHLLGSPGIAPVPRKLSPFDESALECALKLRDVQAQAAIHAMLACSRADEALGRTVAAFRLDSVTNLVIDDRLAWDAAVLAEMLAQEAQAHAPDLILLGREFGDTDDGVLAPTLAEHLQCSFVALAQAVQWQDDAFELMRDRGELVERISLPAPLVASITNDKSNRLRYPLMKNVALARKADIPVRQASVTQPICIRLASAREPTTDASKQGCRMLAGSLEEQAEALALLLTGRAP